LTNKSDFQADAVKECSSYERMPGQIIGDKESGGSVRRRRPG